MEISAQPTVSIITCFLNAESFLPEAIESVLQQDYPHWELVLIDDGSTDNSSRLAQGYASKYPGKILYIQHAGHANKGLSASRNLGIRQASGPLVAFLDADDVWLPAYIGHQVSLMQQHPVAMVCEATEYWFNWQEPAAENIVIPIGAPRQDYTYLPPQLQLDLYPLGQGAAPCVCGIIVKKEILEKHGGFDESFTGMYEDQVFLSKFYLQEPVYISATCHNRYRQRPDSMVGASHQRGEYLHVRRRFLLWLQNYIGQHNLQYPAVEALIQEALLPPPLVSVIIPFLNEEKFLPEAIESVLQQDYPYWELLLVDDGSTDTSPVIAKQYATDYPGKIIYCEHAGHANKGLSASRNLGIRQASGPLVAFLDADDVWLPGKLSNQVGIFQRHPGIGMTAEASEYWKDWDGSQKKNTKVAVGARPDEVYQPGELFYHLYPLGKKPAPCPSSLMLTKAAITRCGGFEESFTKKYQLYEDQAFLNKIFLQEQVYISADCHNRYRQRAGSIVQWVHADGLYHEVRHYFLEWLAAYFRQQHVTDSNLLALLNKALHPYRHPKVHFLTKTLPRKIKQAVKKTLKKATNVK